MHGALSSTCLKKYHPRALVENRESSDLMYTLCNRVTVYFWLQSLLNQSILF